MANLDAMAWKLRPAGYEYFVVDNGWFGEYKLVPGTLYPAEKHASDIRINEYGLVQPSKTCFPSGIQALAGHGHKRECQLTRDQMRTFMTQRALSASPLFPGGDLPTLDDFSISLLTNRRMLACNQNGVMGVNVHAKDDVEVWLTPRRSQPGHGWFGIFNRSEGEKTVTLTAGELGLDTGSAYRLHDIWRDESAELSKTGRAFRIAPDGVAFLAFDADA